MQEPNHAETFREILFLFLALISCAIIATVCVYISTSLACYPPLPARHNNCEQIFIAAGRKWETAHLTIFSPKQKIMYARLFVTVCVCALSCAKGSSAAGCYNACFGYWFDHHAA